MTYRHDLAERSADIHWPDGYDPRDADLFAHNHITIDQPAEAIWQHLIAAGSWPQWYSNSHDVVVDDASGLLAEGVSCGWSTFGLKITSTVAEFVPEERIGWYGTGEGLRAYHTWLLLPDDSITYMVMEEVGLGPGAQQLARTNPGHMHRATSSGTSSLKFLCET